MNRENYSKKTLSTYQILAAYFTDQFYNHLFLKARDNHQINGNENTSLTEEYKKLVLAYKNGLCHPKNREYYSKTIKAILEYYRACTKFRTIGMNEFIDNVLMQFLPEEHFEILTIQEKYFFLNKIIVNVVLEFSRNLLSIPMLKLIIDQHWKNGNADKCKENLVDIMIIEREKIFSKFVKEELKKDGYRDTVDVELLDKLKADREIMTEQFQKVLSEKCKLESENDKLKKIISVLYSEKKNTSAKSSGKNTGGSASLLDRIKMLENQNKKSNWELEISKKQLSEYSKKINQLEIDVEKYRKKLDESDKKNEINPDEPSNGNSGESSNDSPNESFNDNSDESDQSENDSKESEDDGSARSSGQMEDRPAKPEESAKQPEKTVNIFMNNDYSSTDSDRDADDVLFRNKFLEK